MARYTAPETTLVTLGLAVQDKSGTNGLIAYSGCFADTSSDGAAFHAFFDPLTVARFPGVPTDWNASRELIFYANLSRLQAGARFLFTWGVFPGAPDDEILATSAILHRGYQIQATTDDLTYIPISQGLVDLYFVQSGGLWRIARWQDFEDPRADLNAGEFSFGHLRLAGP